MRYRCCNLIHNLITDFPPDIFVDPPPVELPLIISFMDISTEAGGDPTSLANWNAVLVASGNQYTSMTLDVDNNTVYLYGGSNVVLPDFVYGFNANIVSIDDQALSIIEVGATDGGNCFWQATSLTTVTMNAVTRIRLAGFRETGLVTATFNALTQIDIDGIALNPNLTELNIPNIVTMFDGAVAFNTVWNKPAVDFASLVTVHEGAFAGNLLHTSVSLPSCTDLLVNAFTSCVNITTVSLPVCTTIGAEAFTSCDSLVSIDAPACTSFGQAATPDNWMINYNNGVTSALFPVGLTLVNIPLCTSMGATTGDDGTFRDQPTSDPITGGTFTINVAAALATANAGNPDTDLVVLAANNPGVTINYI